MHALGTFPNHVEPSSSSGCRCAHLRCLPCVMLHGLRLAPDWKAGRSWPPSLRLEPMGTPLTLLAVAHVAWPTGDPVTAATAPAS